MGIPNLVGSSPLINYAHLNLPIDNCAPTWTTPYAPSPVLACRINVDSHLRAIFEDLGEVYDEEKGKEIVSRCLIEAKPESFSVCVCQFMKMVWGSFACHGALVTESTSGLTSDLTLYNFPKKQQHQMLDLIRLYSEVSSKDTRFVFSYSIYTKTIFAENVREYISPLEFAFAQPFQSLAQEFINMGANIALLNLNRLPTEKLFWLIPGLKASSHDNRQISLEIFTRGVKEKNYELVHQILSLGHLSLEKCLGRVQLQVAFDEALTNHDDKMIAVFLANGFTFSIGRTPIELAARAGRARRVAELVRNNLHGQRNLELIEKAIRKAYSNQGVVSCINSFVCTDPEVDFSQTIELLTEQKEEIMYGQGGQI